MQRIHRSIKSLARSVNPSRAANTAEDYLEGHKVYKRDLEGIKELVTVITIKNSIKRIDALEREIIRFEKRIAGIEERRAIEAAKLEHDIRYNKKVLKQYFSHSEMKEFRG